MLISWISCYDVTLRRYNDVTHCDVIMVSMGRRHGSLVLTLGKCSGANK